MHLVKVGAVGSVVAQLAREFGAYVIGTGRAADREAALGFGANEFLSLDDEVFRRAFGYEWFIRLDDGDDAAENDLL